MSMQKEESLMKNQMVFRLATNCSISVPSLLVHNSGEVKRPSTEHRADSKELP